MSAELNLSQLIVSRLCHDLVGVAGAINSGLELAGTEGVEKSDALDLVEKSARQITCRLSFFRAAFGTSSGKNFSSAKSIVENYLSEGKTELVWPELSEDAADEFMSDSALKIMLLLILTASECLLRGGKVSVQLASLPEGAGIAIEAEGVTACLREDIKLSLVTPLDQTTFDEIVSPRNIHAFFAQSLAVDAGGAIEYVEATPEKIQFAVLLPA